MPDIYYYSCSYPLENGSIVKPGNWARMLKLYTPAFGNPWILLREKIYEEVRREKFSSKPSRFESLFLCETKDELFKFMASNKRAMDIPYEVKLVEKMPLIHRGCLNIQNIEDGDNHSQLEQKAEQYWSGENIQAVEIVTTSAIKIIGQINA